MGNADPTIQQVERLDHISIRLEDPEKVLVTSIREKLKGLSPLYSGCCIYKVPEKLRNVNEEAYTPRLVSIGPIHRGEENLQAMEEHKWRYLNTFLQIRPEISLEDYVNAIKGWEQNARHYYAETIHLSSNEFAEMLLLDGAFIIELFWLKYFDEARDKNDCIYSRPWMTTDVRRDLRLLENQLPYFVIEGLYNLAFPCQDHKPSLLLLTFCFFRSSEKMKEVVELTADYEIKHFLDLLRLVFLPSVPRRIPKQELKHRSKTEYTPSVTELHEAGVKFKVGKSSRLLDIHFADGVLQIPYLKLENKTESLFRNLMAFEQCHYKHDSYIIDYMAFMDSLINTTKDVDFLVQNGIVENWLGDSKAVATLFNSICKETEFRGSQFYFSGLCEELSAYCKTPWHKWKAALRRDYLSSPWAVISIIAAVLLLVLTFIQSVCSIIAL